MAMYIIAEDPVSGSVVKLPGEVQLCQGAGEVIDGDDVRSARADRHDVQEQPAARVRRLRSAFLRRRTRPAGEPTRCGAYTTEATFVPWSAEPCDEAEDDRPQSRRRSLTAAADVPNGSARVPARACRSTRR